MSAILPAAARRQILLFALLFFDRTVADAAVLAGVHVLAAAFGGILIPSIALILVARFVWL